MHEKADKAATSCAMYIDINSFLIVNCDYWRGRSSIIMKTLLNDIYPYNLIQFLFFKEMSMFENGLTKDQQKGLDYFFEIIDEESRVYLTNKFKEEITWEQFCINFDIPGNKTQFQKFRRNIRNRVKGNGLSNYILYGYEGYQEKLKRIESLTSGKTPIEKLELPQSTYFLLKRLGYETIEEILKRILYNPKDWYMYIDNIKAYRANIIINSMKKYVNLPELEMMVSKECNCIKNKRQARLNITGNIKNIPIRILGDKHYLVWYFDSDGIYRKDSFDDIKNEIIKNKLEYAVGEDLYNISYYRDIMDVFYEELENEIDNFQSEYFKRAACLLEEGDTIEKFNEILLNIRNKPKKIMREVDYAISKIEKPSTYKKDDTVYLRIYIYLNVSCPNYKEILEENKNDVVKKVVDRVLTHKTIIAKGFLKDNIQLLQYEYTKEDTLFLEFFKRD